MRTRMLILSALALLLAWHSAGAQPQGLQLNLQPTGTIQLSVTMDRGKHGAVYAIGEQARVFYQVTTSQPLACAYVYLFDITSSGIVHQIFPNAFSANNCVMPNVQHTVPDLPSYALEVVPPTGQEIIQGLASLAPLNLGTLGGEAFPVLGATPEEAQQRLLAAVSQLNPTTLATDLTSFFVSEAAGPPPLNRAPVACFSVTPPTAMVGQTVWFDAGCSFDPDANDLITSYQWDLNGDGLFESSGRTVSWTYFLPGHRAVRLRVTDAHGATGTATQTVWVTTAAPTPSVNFSVAFVGPQTVRLWVQGSAGWAVARAFQLLVDSDGFFNVATPQVSGNAFHQSLTSMPAPFKGERLDLRGRVGDGGRVEYLITFSTTSTRLRFDLRLDLDGDGFPEQVPAQRILLGTVSPPANPFVVSVS